MSGEALARSGAATAAEGHTDSEQKAEVVPAAVVVDLVDLDIVVEQRADEGEDQGQAIPEPHEETCHMPIGVGRVRQGVGSSAGGDKE